MTWRSVSMFKWNGFHKRRKLSFNYTSSLRRNADILQLVRCLLKNCFYFTQNGNGKLALTDTKAMASFGLIRTNRHQDHTSCTEIQKIFLLHLCMHVLVKNLDTPNQKFLKYLLHFTTILKT